MAIMAMTHNSSINVSADCRTLLSDFIACSTAMSSRSHVWMPVQEDCAHSKVSSKQTVNR